MIWSRYNYLFETDKKHFLYNSLSNSLAELNEDLYFELEDWIKNRNTNILDDELNEQFRKMKVLVENDNDEINKIKYLNSLKRNNKKKLMLTINPTLACNFACSYCFEKQHPNILMDEIVEDNIIRYISLNQNIETLDVTWFGGEPLLAFEQIISLTKKMQSLGLKYNASMITNGYLLSEKVISTLPSLSISSLQITIDGLATLHNSRRHLKSGAPTFEKIVSNIDILKKSNPQINVTIRMNVDNKNDSDFINLYNYFYDKNYKNLSISLAFVKDLSGCNICSSIYNRDQQAQFVIKMRRKYGLDFSFLYPSSNRYECAIRNENSLVIGPKGELYKCWDDVGNETKIIGNIDGKITNESLLLRYLTGADPFEDPKCKACLLLPVCGGGCPNSRLKNEYEGKDINNCLLIKDHLNEFLFTHAMFKKK